MNRWIGLALVFVAVLSISAGSTSANSSRGAVNTKKFVFVTDLIGAQHWDIGDVLVWHDADTLYVKYELHHGWLRLVETHLHVGTSLNDIPLKGNGNPAPGQFDYKVTHGRWDMEHTYEIPLDPSWGTGTDIFIAAHCSITGLCGLIETGWGDGLPCPGKNWAMFFIYTM